MFESWFFFSYLLLSVVVWKLYAALAGVAQWTEHRPAHQNVSISIPTQGTCLGCRTGPQ